MKKKRILLIDDDQGMTDAVRRMLEEAGGYEVLEENFSELALETALKFAPDLILVDWNMPIMNGADVAGQFTQDSELRNTPLAFITAFGTRANKLGRPVLEKPFSQAQLIDLVARLLTAPEIPKSQVS